VAGPSCPRYGGTKGAPHGSFQLSEAINGRRRGPAPPPAAAAIASALLRRGLECLPVATCLLALAMSGGSAKAMDADSRASISDMEVLARRATGICAGAEANFVVLAIEVAVLSASIHLSDAEKSAANKRYDTLQRQAPNTLCGVYAIKMREAHTLAEFLREVQP
jgi:hypothetical protein